MEQETHEWLKSLQTQADMQQKALQNITEFLEVASQLEQMNAVLERIEKKLGR